MSIRFLILMLTVALTTPVLAADGEDEIQYLLHTIGASNCTFVRNGTTHTAREAESHLSMKYRRAGARIKTAEKFIKYLASESSWTGKAYAIECAGLSTPSRDWLTSKLNSYRAAEHEDNATDPAQIESRLN